MIKNKMSTRLLLLASVLACFFLTGCTPNGYTREARDTITREHKADAEAWFSSNMPEAKIDSAEAFTYGQELFMAIGGRYSVALQSYEYVYDFKDNIMYLEEYGEEINGLINSELARAFNIDEEQISANVKFYFDLTSANNQYTDRYGYTEYGEKTGICANVLPYGCDPDDIANDTLYGENPDAKFTAIAFVNEIPEYDYQVISSLVGLDYVTFKRPIDLEYDGIYYAVYSRNREVLHYAHLEQVQDNLCVGYTIDEELSVSEDGIVSDGQKIACAKDFDLDFEGNAENTFSFAYPPDSKPLFIGPKAEYLDCYYLKNGDYVKREPDECYKYENSPRKDYVEFSYCLIFPETKLRVYRANTYNNLSSGKMTIEKK